MEQLKGVKYSAVLFGLPLEIVVHQRNRVTEAKVRLLLRPKATASSPRRRACSFCAQEGTAGRLSSRHRCFGVLGSVRFNVTKNRKESSKKRLANLHRPDACFQLTTCLAIGTQRIIIPGVARYRYLLCPSLFSCSPSLALVLGIRYDPSSLIFLSW